MVLSWPFLRYGDLFAKNCLFFLPLSHSAPSLAMFPLEFRAEVNHEETRVMGLSSSEDPMIVAWVILTQCQRVTVRRTNGRTDGRIYCSYYSALHSKLCWRAVKSRCFHPWLVSNDKKKFAALLLIGMASPYQILDWYGGRHTCHTASGALVCIRLCRYTRFLGRSPSRQTFSWILYRGLRKRWMRESRCYFFYHTPKKWGVRYPPLQKVGGTRI